MGRNEKESGGGSEEGGGNEERKGNQWKIGRWRRGEKGKHEMKKPSRCAKREVWRKYRVRSLEEVPEAWGNTGKSKEKVSFGAEKSDVPSQNRRNLDSKWENGKENRR